MTKTAGNEAEFVLSEDRAPGLSAAERLSLMQQLQLYQLKGQAIRLNIQSDCAAVDKKLLRLKAERLKLVQEVDSKISALEASRLAIAAANLSALADIEGQIESLVAQLKSGVDNEVVKITYKSNGVSVTYDYKVLDDLKDVKPDVWANIVGARREKDKSPTIKIEWK